MRKNYASRSGLFLIELIFSIFFFIIAAAIVLQLFVKSHFVCENTISINNSLLYTQNISEVFLANNGDFDTVKALYADALTDLSSITDDAVLLLFDQNWCSTKSIDKARYSVLACYRKEDNFAYVDIYTNQYLSELTSYIANGDYKSILMDQGSIYHQEVKKYVR